MTFLSDFDKLLVVGLIVVVGLVLVSAGNVSTSQPYHAFSQITGVGFDSVAPLNVLLPVYGGTGVTGCLDGNVLKWNTVQSKWVCGGVDANIVNVYNALTNNYTTLQQTVTNVQQNISDINQTVVNLNQTIVNGGSLPVCSAGQTIVYNGFSWACSTGTAVAGVSKIIAGTNVTISPASGTGDVTINASASGGGSTVITFIQPYTLEGTSYGAPYCLDFTTQTTPYVGSSYNDSSSTMANGASTVDYRYSRYVQISSTHPCKNIALPGIIPTNATALLVAFSNMTSQGTAIPLKYIWKKDASTNIPYVFSTATNNGFEQTWSGLLPISYDQTVTLDLVNSSAAYTTGVHFEIIGYVTSGSVSGSALPTCTVGQTLQSTGSGWNCAPSVVPVATGLYGYCVYGVTRGDGAWYDQCGTDLTSFPIAPTSPAYCVASSYGKVCSCVAGYTSKLLSYSYAEIPKDGGNPYGTTTNIISCMKN